MAKQKPQINGSVRHKGNVYTAGMEEDLAKVLGNDDAKRLIEKGVITGVEIPKEEEPESKDLGKDLGGKKGNAGSKETTDGKQASEEGK